ncbi:MAG: hypothetical protein Q7R52_00965 [archaeon]|nr:hypothetical protein [archaeon]
METDEDLEKLKKNFEEIRSKYNLPFFRELNEDFHIEKAVEFEGELLIREVRRFMGDKLYNYMRFVEGLVNPVNVSMFAFSMVKAMKPEDKKILEEIYKKLTKIEIKLVRLDIEYSEKEEAEFIIETYKEWQNMKKDTMKILDSIESNFDSKSESNNKNYFG